MEEPAPPDDADDADVSVERFGRPRRAEVRAGARGGRRDLQSGDRAYGHQVASRRMAAAHRRELLADWPTATEDEIAWAAVELLSVDAAKLLEPAFAAAPRPQRPPLGADRSPPLPRRSPAIVRQAERFDRLAPNIIVKIPATAAGIAAIEAATAQGITHQRDRLLHAAAVRRRRRSRSSAGSTRRAGAGPRRLDDGTGVHDHGRPARRLAEGGDGARRASPPTPGHLEWAGVAVFKKTYRLFVERGYRVRLLSAAFRNHMHWSELIGGDVVISPP